MADDRHEARRAISAWKTARYQRRIAASITAALATHRQQLLAAGLRPGTPPPDPFNLAGWQASLDANVQPAVHSVLMEILDDIAKAAGVAGGGAYLLGKVSGPNGQTVNDVLQQSTDQIVVQARALGETVAGKVTMTISTASDAGKLASSMNSIFDLADVQTSYVARSANFFANALATQGALSVQGEGEPMQKTWTTMGDDKVRPDHEDVDGTTLPVDQAFNVGGDDLMYPGDPSGSEEETSSCRCWLVFEPGTGQSAESAQAEEDALTASVTGPMSTGHTVEVGWLGGSRIVTRRSPLTPPNRKQRRAAVKSRRAQ